MDNVYVSCLTVNGSICLFEGVLSHLSVLEVLARSRKSQPQQQSRVKELKAKAAALMLQRDQLKAEIQTHQVR